MTEALEHTADALMTMVQTNLKEVQQLTASPLADLPFGDEATILAAAISEVMRSSGRRMYGDANNPNKGIAKEVMTVHVEALRAAFCEGVLQFLSEESRISVAEQFANSSIRMANVFEAMVYPGGRGAMQ